MILRQDQPSRYAGLQCASRKLSPRNLPRERFSSLALTGCVLCGQAAPVAGVKRPFPRCPNSAGALALLADMPDVTSAILDQLIAAFNCAPDRAAVAPVYQGRRGNPVLLGRRLFPRLALLNGDEGARRLLGSTEGVLEIAVDEKSVLADIDTREDLERALGGRL